MFEECKDTVVVYHSSAKVWMENDILTKFLQVFDRSIKIQKTKIILFIDLSAHPPDMSSLKNTEVNIFFS